MNISRATIDGKVQFTSPRLSQTGSHSAKWASRLKRSSQAAGTLALVIAGVVLVGGYIFGNNDLRNLAPGLPKMMPNTAIGLSLAAISLLLYASKPAKHEGDWRIWIPRLLALIVFLIGTATIAEYLLRINLGIDQLLFPDRTAASTFPGRPSPQTSVNFILAGLSLMLLGGKQFWALRISQLLAVIVGFAAIVAMVGYVYSALPLYGITSYTGMAIHTALSFLLISTGIVFADSERGLAAVFTSESEGGHLARRLLPAIIIVPIGLGILSKWGERNGLFSAETGMAADVTLHILLLGAELWLFAQFLERANTARDAAIEAMNRHSTQVEAANRELQALSHAVPLNLLPSVKSAADLSNSLWEDNNEHLSEKGKENVASIRKSVETIRYLVDDLLKLSQVSNAGMSRETVKLSEIAESILTSLSQASPEHKVQFTVAPGLTEEGDRSLLWLALENLLENAWKFSSKVPEPIIEVNTVKHNGIITYFVRDNGIGFDMADADKLFQPFHRLHDAEDYRGTGIGLTIVQRIIRRHGGDIWVESKANEGTTFFFTLG